LADFQVRFFTLMPRAWQGDSVRDAATNEAELLGGHWSPQPSLQLPISRNRTSPDEGDAPLFHLGCSIT